MYNDTVLDHFNNPRNMGELENADAEGEVGNPVCGDKMKIWINIDDKGIITDAKFKTFGCASAVASSSMSTVMIIGKHIDQARAIKNSDIVDALGGLPEPKIHCSVLASQAIGRAIDKYLGVTPTGDNQMICECMNVTLHDIKEAIAAGADDLEMIAEVTGATLGDCDNHECKEKIEEILSGCSCESCSNK